MVNKFLNSIYFPKTYIVEPEFHSPTRKNVKKKTIRYELSGRELDHAETEKTKALQKEGEEFSFGRRAYLTKKERMVKREIEYINLYPKNLKILAPQTKNKSPITYFIYLSLQDLTI